MIDLPPAIVEPANFFSIGGIDLGNIREQAEGMKPLLTIAQDTWSRETLADIIKGKVFISDKVINDAIAGRLRSDAKIPLAKLALTSSKDKLKIAAETKTGDIFEFSGKIIDFVHRGDKTYMTYKIERHEMPGQGIYSFLFANLSLSMVQSLMGDIELGETLPVSLEGNELKMDFSPQVAASAFGKAKVGPIPLKDAVEIVGANPKDGGLEVKTRLNLPDNYKKMLQDLVASGRSRLGR